MIELRGLNIQWPWSELLLTGKKTIETRNYPLPEWLKNQPVAIIETPGKKRKDFKARIVGVIVFNDCKEYTTQKSWNADYSKHLVDPDDLQFKFVTGLRKCGWIVGKYCLLKKTTSPPISRGMVYATGCKLPMSEIQSIL